MQMASAQQGLKRLAGTIGFLSVAVLLNTLVCAKPAAAQCGPGSDDSNTECGTGALANNTFGGGNSAFGFDALHHNTTGNNNTASGLSALVSNTMGSANVASGYDALGNNSTGSANTASGTFALLDNTTGDDNTASGLEALVSNSTGSANTASGERALFDNTTGSDNTASGYYAMGVGTTIGTYNTATGAYALANDTSGVNNVATGAGAEQHNTIGRNNVGEGGMALYSNVAGSNNTALGGAALRFATGSNNIGIGSNAGLNLGTGSNNIEIGSQGAASDAGNIRIGTQGMQTRTFIAGVSGILSGGSEATELAVNRTTGQVGVIPSSARFKRDIHDMGGASTDLMKLRPVTFRYKQDLQGQRQYGLIAEEVAKVYPALVVRGDKGEIESVQYRELIPLMLNEMQHQQAALTALEAQNTALQARLERLESAKTVASR